MASALTAPDPAASPAARFTPTGRLAAAATLVLAGAFQLAAFATEPGHDHTIDRLRWIADNPDRADLAKLFDVLGMPFLFGVAVVYILLSRDRSPRLAYAGGLMLGCGMVGLTAVQGAETIVFSLAQDGRFALPALTDVVDNAATPAGVAILVLFIPFAFFGLLTSAVALWRSGAAPRGAILLIPVFILLDFFLQLGFVAHLVALIGDCWVASAVLLAGHAQTEHDTLAAPSPG